MRIKTSDQPQRWGRKTAGRRLFRIALLVCYTAAILALGAYLNRTGDARRWAWFAISLFKTPDHISEGMLADPEHLQIDIKFKNYQQLAHQREMALRDGVLVTGDDDYVKASIRHDGETVPVKMRLKGDWLDHLDGKKWSFRFRARGDHTLFGMKQFSIHHPKTRNYLMEWVYHSALRREGVLALRYDFVSVSLNGNSLGVYALEEHFEKRLVESQNRREGPIIRFSETRFWDAVQQRGKTGALIPDWAGNYSASEIDSFQTTDWLADPKAREVHNRAISLLESFRRGDRKTSEVFDVNLLARYFAITDLVGGEHGSRWHNVRFYFNPITARLEPIGFDAGGGNPISSLIFYVDTPYAFYKDVFSDQDFFGQYLVELDRVSRPEYLDELLEELADGVKRNLRIIYSEFPEYRFSTDVLYQNQHFIRHVLNPPAAILAYRHEREGSELELQIGNMHPIPIRILGASIGETKCELVGNELKLPPRLDPNNDLVAFQPLRIRLPIAFSREKLDELRVHFRLHGSDEPHQASVVAWPHIDGKLEAADLTRAQANVQEFAFLEIDEMAKTIRAKPGEWTIDKDLIVPSGYRWSCVPGTILQLTSSASILSHSPLEFIGSEEAPIRIVAPNGDGQGIVVFAGNQRSVLKHVVFENLSNPSRPGWSLTGAVTFYESPVEFHNCRFEANRCEDGVNLVRSKFLIADCVFSRTEADAFDADFCEGSLQDTRFLNCGNDAIDVSGSSVKLEGVQVGMVGDKGLSVGENSLVNARYFSVAGAKAAIAVKDLSRLKAEHLRIRDSAIGFAVYQKKTEFGPGSATVSKLDIESTDTPFMVEHGSKLQVEGNVIGANCEKLREEFR